MKIEELVVGNACDIPLVVKTVTPKKTRSEKDYLFFELFDGTEVIVGNYWDWNGNAQPAKNAILNVVGKVDSWMGKKQINIKSLTTNTELSLADFMPKSEHDLGEAYKSAYALLSDVKDNTLRSIALGILEDEQALWLTVPGAMQVHHAHVGGTLVHCLAVARIAKAIAGEVKGANEDLCVVGGFLHDLGKLYTYYLDGVSIEMSSTSKLMEHTFLGARRLDEWAQANIHLEPKNAAKLEVLLHIILSHHGRAEYGAPVPPLSLEANIIAKADGIDACAAMIQDASKTATDMWTDKIWPLNNRPHLAIGYVQRTFEEEN